MTVTRIENVKLQIEPKVGLDGVKYYSSVSNIKLYANTFIASMKLIMILNFISAIVLNKFGAFQKSIRNQKLSNVMIETNREIPDAQNLQSSESQPFGINIK